MELQALSRKQADSILQSTARLNIWHGPVRSGKTFSSLIRWAQAVRESKGSGDLVMVGKTERTLERNILRPLEQLLGHRNVTILRGSGEAWIYGKRVYTIGANDEGSEKKIRGGTFEKLYGDELTLWPESFFTMALSRLSVSGAQLFGTTNPDSPAHWLKRNFLDREAELNLRAFAFTMRDNRTLSAEFLEALRSEYTGLWRKRFIEGLWVAAEGAIWDAFDADVHVVDAIPEGLEFRSYMVGVDYGTSNPFVALLIGRGSDGRLWVLDEWRWDSRAKGRQRTDAEYSTEVKGWLAGHGVVPDNVWVDPSAASFILQAQRDDISAVVPADNEVLDGIRVVSTEMSGDRLRVLRRCAGLINEIQSYCWDPKKQARGEDAPIKANDHGCDALRYPIYSSSTSVAGQWIAYAERKRAETAARAS